MSTVALPLSAGRIMMVSSFCILGDIRFKESCPFNCPHYIGPELSCFGVCQVFSHGLSAGDYVSDGQFGWGYSVVQPLPEH